MSQKYYITCVAHFSLDLSVLKTASLFDRATTHNLSVDTL